jgi:myxalamid-type polyketide synthase MxaB
MARDYVLAIRQVQPEGPYYLCGWSTGGIFAYEMARQLRAQGAALGALVFFDTPTPSIFDATDLNDNARFLYDLVNFSNWFAGTNMRVSYELLRAQDMEQSLHTLLEEGKRHQVLPADVTADYLQRRIDVCKENVRTLMEYDPAPFDQPVVMFRPTDTSALAEASGQSLSQNLGWGKILGDLLTTHSVPGDHFSMMAGENVRVLAEGLSMCLEETLPDRRPVTATGP